MNDFPGLFFGAGEFVSYRVHLVSERVEKN